MHKRYILGVSTCAALAISAVAYAQAPVDDINALQSRQGASSAAAPGNSLEQRITILERMVDSRTQMQHRLQQQLDTMQGEIDDLRGAVEVHTNQLDKVLERQRELYLEIDKRVEALKQSGALSSTVNTSSSQSNSVASPVNSGGSGNAVSGNESDAYEAAVNLILETREYDKAIPAFQAFLGTYPNGEYAANAHFWLGQLLFNKQQWDDAAEQFNVVIERFSDSSKRPEAILKLGVIASRQGDKARAKTLFQRVLNEHPNSSVSKLAQARLNSL